MKNNKILPQVCSPVLKKLKSEYPDENEEVLGELVSYVFYVNQKNFPEPECSEAEKMSYLQDFTYKLAKSVYLDEVAMSEFRAVLSEFKNQKSSDKAMTGPS